MEPRIFAVQYLWIFLWSITPKIHRFFNRGYLKYLKKNAAWEPEILWCNATRHAIGWLLKNSQSRNGMHFPLCLQAESPKVEIRQTVDIINVY